MQPQTREQPSIASDERHGGDSGSLPATVLRDLRAVAAGEKLYPRPRHRLEKLGLVRSGGEYLTQKGREALEHSS